MRKLVLVLVVLLMACQGPKNEKPLLNAQVGDYIEFGQYMDQAIVWQVIDKEGEDYILWSDKILTFKSFDAASSGQIFYTSTGQLLYDIEEDFFNDAYDLVDDYERVEAFGSGRWRTSSLRAWLNAVGQVEYNHMPTSDATFPSYLAYDDEKGFLSGFSYEERLLIKEREHKVLIYMKDENIMDGGNQIHDYVWNLTPSQSVKNYNKTYYETVKDQVFLLSVWELGRFIDDRGLNYLKEATDKAKLNLETKRTDDTHYEYWLRTPYPERVSSVRTCNWLSSVSSWISFSNEVGVVPAISISGSHLYESEGDGSLERPYRISHKK